MIVSKPHFYNTNTQRGASVLEVVLAITVVLSVSPFVYTQTIKMANDVRDIANANKIVSLRDGVINYIRINQSQWPDTAEIKMGEEDIKKIAPSASNYKFTVTSSTVYSGKAQKPAVTASKLKENKDYTVTYKNNTNPGVAPATKKASHLRVRLI